MRSHWICLVTSVLVFSCSMMFGFEVSKPSDRRIEVGLWGGLSPLRIVGTNTIQDSWNSLLLNSVTERTVIQSDAKTSPAAGAYFSIFLTPHLGLQFLFGYGQANLTTSASFDFAWAWADGISAAKSKTWSGNGRLTRVPACLNLVLKEGIGLFTIEVSGGLAYYWNTLREESTFGYGVTRISLAYQPPDWMTVQTVDALPVNLAIPATSWQAVGVNIGASLNVRLSDLVGLKAEARYFYCPPKGVPWTPAVGTYDGLFGESIRGEPFTTDDIDYLTGSGQTFEQKTDLSFVQLSLGITFFLGSLLRH